MASNTAPPSILVFDVNETLLDITTLEPLFTRIFDNRAVMREWFAQLVLYSQTLTLSGIYLPFGELGAGVLCMVAKVHGVAIEDSDVEELGERISTMPAHADAAPALTRLQEAGFRLVTLTNSPSSASPTPLERAGLARFFERNFSVETVEQFKPAAATYNQVAQEMGVETSHLCLVACHLWDTIGAQAAGCHGALVTRPWNAVLPSPKVPLPEITAPDLTGLAEQIVRLWRPSL